MLISPATPSANPAGRSCWFAATPGERTPTTAGGRLETLRTTRESDSSPSAVPLPLVQLTFTTSTGRPLARFPWATGPYPTTSTLPPPPRSSPFGQRVVGTLDSP